MEWITYFKDLGVPQFIMLMLFAYFMWKAGLFNGKSKNGNGHFNPESLKADILHTIETNHFHTVGEKLDRIETNLTEMRDFSRDSLKILEEIKNKICIK